MPENEDSAPNWEVYWNDLRRPAQESDVPVEPPGPFDDPNNLVIGSRNRKLVAITPQGEVITGPGYTPSEAATIFWEHMGQRRLMMEERILIIHHMEGILVRLGQQDMQCERLRQEAAVAVDPVRKAELTQAAEISMNRLNMIATEAIELGRGLARRDIPTPEVPNEVPTSFRQNPNTDYQGRAGLPDEDPEL